MATNRIRLVAVALVVAVMLAATSGAASAPARGEGSSAPPRSSGFQRELRNGAKSVIVFVSAGDKEYVATGGERRPTGSQRFRGERDEDVHCNNRARARGGGGLCASAARSKTMCLASSRGVMR